MKDTDTAAHADSRPAPSDLRAMQRRIGRFQGQPTTYRPPAT
ncbi:hypothetical protein [Rhodophyticola sp.]